MNNPLISKIILPIAVLAFFALSTGCGGGSGGGETAASDSAKFTVTYDGNGNTGGSVPVDTTGYEQGQSVTVLGNTGGLVRTGYTFTGWSVQANGAGTSYTPGQIFAMGAANLTLYAKWTTNPTCTVTYVGNGNTGGSVPVDTTGYEQGSSVTILGNTGGLVKTGYTFTGWSTQADGAGTSYTPEQIFIMGSDNVILYAKWSANPTYTVTYVGNGNTAGSVPVDTTRYEQGTSVTVLGNTNNLIKTGYTFIGWCIQANGTGTSYTPGQIFTMGSSNVMLYAKWSINSTYTVTYSGNNNTGGSVPVDTTRYEQGTSVTVPGNTGSLVRTGFTFSGWNTLANGSGTSYTQGQIFTMGSANVTLYARWNANPTYSMTYAGNGNTGGSVPVDTTRYEQGTSVTVLGNTNNLIKTGYTFTGWNTQANGTGTSYAQGQILTMGSANVTLYAKWTANPTYTVTYAGNGNTGGSVPVDTTKYEHGTSVTVLGNTNNLIKTGYTFTGWNTQVNGTGTSYTQGQIFTMGSANVTLYAKWTANPTYTVTYSGNGNTGGSAPVDTTRYEQGTSVTVLSNTGGLVRTGYTFTGWNTQANGAGTSYTPGQIFTMGSANVTLYAKWTANPTSSNFIIDHTCAKLGLIPSEWISQAKSELHIGYQHSSHGSQITDGMTGLASWKGSLYAFNNGGSSGALDLRDCDLYIYAYNTGTVQAEDLGNNNWKQNTRNYLNAKPQINVIMWSWCGQVSGSSEADINDYLNSMTQLEQEFPNVMFVYMTGHVDGGRITDNCYIRNEQIRKYCRDNDKILYDFADIESWNPDGVSYVNKLVLDSCYYDANGNGNPWDDTANWAIDWQNSHIKGVDWYDCESAHSQPLNANLKAYAAWWLFARLAGWDGE